MSSRDQFQNFRQYSNRRKFKINLDNFIFLTYQQFKYMPSSKILLLIMQQQNDLQGHFSPELSRQQTMLSRYKSAHADFISDTNYLKVPNYHQTPLEQSNFSDVPQQNQPLSHHNFIKVNHQIKSQTTKKSNQNVDSSYLSEKQKADSSYLSEKQKVDSSYLSEKQKVDFSYLSEKQKVDFSYLSEIKRVDFSDLSQKISNSPLASKTVEQLKKQLRRKQERQKFLFVKIKFILNQLYMPVLELDSLKQVTQQWILMANIGLKIKTKHNPTQTSLKSSKAIQLPNHVINSNYEVKKYYEELLLKNVKNQRFIQEYRKSAHSSKINESKNKSQIFARLHLQKWQKLNSSKIQQIRPLLLSSKKCKEASELDKSRAFPSQKSRKQLIIQNSSMSLLKSKHICESPSLIMKSQSPSIMNKINLKKFHKTRQSIFGDLKRTMKFLMEQEIKKSSNELPMILKRYRAMTSSKEDQMQYRIQQKTQIKKGQTLSVSQRQHQRNQHFKTETYNYLNAKTQILNSKRKKYILNNIQMGQQDQQSVSKTPAKIIQENPLEESHLQKVNSKINAHRQIYEFSEEKQKRKFQRLAFIQQLRQHLKLNNVTKKSPFLNQKSNKNEENLKSPYIIHISPDRIFTEHSQKIPNKFIPNNKKILKDRSLKIKKQLSFRTRNFKMESMNFINDNFETSKHLPLMS